jgi:hypothetical protein
MRNLLTALTSLLLLSTSTFAQTGNIRFTVKKSAAQNNQIQIYGKNFTASTLSGILGASNLTLCVAFPSMYTGVPTITSPISGQTFDAPSKNKVGSDSVYSWNGLGTTGNVDFPSNVEVLLATVTFNGSSVTTTVKIANVAGGGPSTFDYCYIALSGTEQSGYSTPFYSNITSDPLLINANGGASDPYSAGASSLGISGVALPTKFLSFFATKSNDEARLTWTVDNEQDNQYFDVEGSTDGRTFTTLQRVNALRNGRASNTYSATDATISRYRVKTVYYRIKQIESSGTILYSEVRQVNLSDKSFAATLYPNPVKTITKLVVDAPEAAKATIIIRDANGKTVKQMTLQLTRGINQQQIDATLFAAGDYNLTIMADKLNQTIKLTKSN